jgi:hypothetical protein
MKSTLQFLFLALLTIFIAACGGRDDEKCLVIPDPPVRGTVCVSALDQTDTVMTGCTFDFEVAEAVLQQDEDYIERYGDPGTLGYDPKACEDNALTIYGAPGQYNVHTECGKLIGNLSVDLDKGKNAPFASRLIGSFCTDNTTFETDPQHPVVELQDHLGFSTATRCANWFDRPQFYNTEVVKMTLDCPDTSNDCNPMDGRDYLIIMGKPGEYSDGKPKHLKLTAQNHLVPDGEEVTVKITLRQTNGPEQELEIPILIRGPVCGNGILEFKEKCEGTDLHGLTCQYFGFDGGNLECVNCQVSKDGCFNTEEPEAD